MIKDVVVNITEQTSPLSTQGFGLPLILATNVNKPYTIYTSLPAVAIDYPVGTNAYTMASEMFSQNPAPSQIAIIGVAYTQIPMVRASLTTALTGANNNIVFTSKVLGANGNYIQIQYTNPGAVTAATAATLTGAGTSASPYVINVTLAYNAGAITAKASDVITAINGNAQIAALVSPALVTGNDGTGLVTALAATSLAGGVAGSNASTLTTALNTLMQTNNQWYWLTCDMHGTNEIVALVAWAQANQKFYFAVSSDLNLINLNTINTQRFYGIYHNQDSLYPDAGLAAIASCAIPGSMTFKFKTIQGIPVANITDSTVLQIMAMNWNTYVNKFGILQTSSGLSSSGDYADDIISQDWVNVNIVQDVSQLLFSMPKVPYDNKGIGLIVSTILTVLKQAANNGIILLNTSGKGQYSVTAPLRENVSATNIAQRVLPNVAFTYKQAGAVETITVNGLVTF